MLVVGNSFGYFSYYLIAMGRGLCLEAMGMVGFRGVEGKGARWPPF